MKCFSGDGRDAVGVWWPKVNQSGDVRVLVCEQHMNNAREQGFGPTRLLKGLQRGMAITPTAG